MEAKKGILNRQLVGIGAGLLLTVLSTSAFARGTCCCDPWNGPYIGAYYGAGKGNDLHQTFRTNQIINYNSRGGILAGAFTAKGSGHGKLNGDITGSSADLFIGWGFHPRCTNYVLGVQFEGTVFSDLELHGKGQVHILNTFTQEPETTPPPGLQQQVSLTAEQVTTVYTEDELRSMFSLVGRAGYLVSPCLLIYGLAALNDGHFVVPNWYNNIGGTRSKWEWGWSLGLGLEYKVTCKWSILAEYRFIRFDYSRSQHSSYQITIPFDPFNLNYENHRRQHWSTDFDLNYGKIGVVYRFC